LTVPNMYF